MSAARESDYVSETRQLARQLWDAVNGLVALQREWNALDYGNTLNTFEGENTGLVAADVGAVVFDTVNAIVSDVLSVGHATNLSKLL